MPGRIDDVGLNVQPTTPTIVPKLTPDIMSYCSGNWCSVQCYEYLSREGVL